MLGCVSELCLLLCKSIHATALRTATDCKWPETLYPKFSKMTTKLNICFNLNSLRVLSRFSRFVDRNDFGYEMSVGR